MSSAPSSSLLSQWLHPLWRQVHTYTQLQFSLFVGSVSSVRYVCTLFSGIGCAIIFTGVPVYFIVVSDDYVKKPESVRRFLGEQIFQEPSGVLLSLWIRTKCVFSSIWIRTKWCAFIPLIKNHVCLFIPSNVLFPLTSWTLCANPQTPHPAASETIWLQKLFMAVATDKTD